MMHELVKVVDLAKVVKVVNRFSRPRDRRRRGIPPFSSRERLENFFKKRGVVNFGNFAR
jgi:hypothetical protein